MEDKQDIFGDVEDEVKNGNDEVMRDVDDEVKNGNDEVMSDAQEDMEQDNESVSDADSIESEESQDDQKREEKERELVALEKQLAGNIYDYNLHVSVVNLLKEIGEFDRLRLARKEMSKLFPLSEQLWLDWLQDEAKVSTSDEEKKAVKDLFETAVGDYLSVPVWLEYCQFTIGLGEIEEVRKVFERAVQAAGLHVSTGAILWEAYREYELCILQTLVSRQGKEDEISGQKQRIEKLFKRQLSCPLLNNEATFGDYEKWKSEDGEKVEPSVKEQFDKANELLEKVLPFEEELLREGEKSDIYRRYLKFETENGDPARILCLYERALADCSLASDIWLQYVNYVDRKLRDVSLSLKIHEKSIRNCPWVGDLWCSYILMLERLEKEKSEVLQAVEKALAAGLSPGVDYKKVWFSYIDYIRRQAQWEEGSEKDLEELREILGRATQHVLSTFGLEGDPECELYQYWARLEFSRGSLEEARKLWTEILGLGVSGSAIMWLNYLTLEQKYGDSKHVRKLFQRALQAETDWPEGIANAWMMFEREKGDLEQFEFCLEKCETRLASVYEKRMREADEQKAQKPKKSDRAKDFKQKKEKKDVEKRKNVEPKQKEEIKKDSEAVKRKTPPDHEEPGQKREKMEMAIVPEEFGVLTDGAEVPEKTVFLSNLDFSIEEDQIKELMSSSGKVASVRLVRNYNKKSKGFAYVVFSSPDEVEEVLKRDRELVNGRPMFISRYETDSTLKTPVFKFPNRLEKNKLFVKGLPKTKTKEDIEKLFEPYGRLKEVRIVTFRSGQPKGLAYVDYEDEAAAALAVVKTDGMEIDGLKISVAISNPPPRKDDGFASAKPVASLGGGAKPTGSRGKGRSQIALVPVSVQRKSTTNATSVGSGAVNGSEKAPAKSNEDFRKMLLGLK